MKVFEITMTQKIFILKEYCLNGNSRNLLDFLNCKEAIKEIFSSSKTNIRLLIDRKNNTPAKYVCNNYYLENEDIVLQFESDMTLDRNEIRLAFTGGNIIVFKFDANNQIYCDNLLYQCKGEKLPPDVEKYDPDYCKVLFTSIER